jgi:hypothetical protein
MAGGKRAEVNPINIKHRCHAEPVEAWWAGPLRATLRQAQGDRPAHHM